MGRLLNSLAACIAVLTVCCSGPTSAPVPPVSPPTVLASVVSPPIISSLTIKSTNAYRVHTGGMAVGDTVYTDRNYRTVVIPPAVGGASWVQTANNDKNRDLKDTAYMHFTVAVPVVVYVAHDNRATIPTWLATWTATNTTISNTDLYGKQFLGVRKKAFPAGVVTLGANNDVSQNSNMYMVMVQPDTTVVGSPHRVAHVVITPAPDTLAVGTTKQLQVALTDSVGNAVADSVTWQSTTPSVASVTSTGLVAGVTAGTSTIIVTASDSVQGSAFIDVTATSVSHAGWYVAPNGSSGASGTVTSPWDLGTALAGAGGRIHPGDTVWLRGGTYGSGEGSSNYTASLSGTAAAPIIVRQYPGERTTIDGDIFVGGAYTWYWDFELANTNAAAQNVQGINAQCPGCRFINLVVHDHSGDGIGTWDEGPNEVVYGNIVYNNGFTGSNPGVSFGHGIYAQNETGTKLLQDNVLFDQFGYGFHLYTQAGFLNNFTVDGNVSFNSGIADGMNYTMGGGVPLVNLIVRNNVAYYNPDALGNSFRIGYNFGVTNSGGTVTNNYVVGTAFISQWTSNLTFTGNTVISVSSADVNLDQDAPTASTWNQNAYYYTGAFVPFDGLGVGYDFAEWKAKFGYDANSTMSSSTPPNHVVVEPNAYEPGRANLVVVNWNNAGSVTVDLSTVLRSGQAYRIVDAQKFYGTPVVSGTYAGGTVTIPIQSVTPPTAINGKAMPSTGTQFKVYVVLPQ